ncbi:MAG: SPOR domain-containing protein [Sphingomicrobium sp.]
MMKQTARLALTAIALTLAAPAAAQSVRAGIEAWQKGDFAAAITVWRPLAAKGDADAAFNLGQAYRLGKGVPLSLASAQSWYEKAARAGHVDAATSLGILLFQNGNRTSSMRWLKQAAEAGEPRALLLYGTALYNGDGVPPDPVTAYAFVSRAAAQGLAPARATLADMDALMPVEQRQQGVALAKAAVDAKAGAKPAVKPVRTAKPVAAKPMPPSVKVATGGGWRVQLGAFAKRGSAEGLFKSLSAGPLAGRQAYYVAAGAVTRLQAGPYASKAEAAAACTRLSARGQACFPVAAR